MGEVDAIDAELRQLAAARDYIRKQGRLPRVGAVDELLDKRLMEAAFESLVDKERD